jgi:hypothetical protein
MILNLIITIGSLGAMMWVMLKFMLRDIHKDITDIKTAQNRVDHRLDNLYQICVELLKWKRP